MSIPDSADTRMTNQPIFKNSIVFSLSKARLALDHELLRFTTDVPTCGLIV